MISNINYLAHIFGRYEPLDQGQSLRACGSYLQKIWAKNDDIALVSRKLSSTIMTKNMSQLQKIWANYKQSKLQKNIVTGSYIWTFKDFGSVKIRDVSVIIVVYQNKKLSKIMETDSETLIVLWHECKDTQIWNNFLADPCVSHGIPGSEIYLNNITCKMTFVPL